jgi:hypothetical protein
MQQGDLNTQIIALAVMIRNLERELDSAQEDFQRLLLQWEQSFEEAPMLGHPV